MTSSNPNTVTTVLMASDIERLVRLVVEDARNAALRKHGPLKGGMGRWSHHLEEECEEAMDEMLALNHFHDPELYHEHKVALIVELAQVAQLAIGMMEMLYQNREQEEKETWKPKEMVD